MTVTDEEIQTVEQERSRTIASFEEAKQALAAADVLLAKAETAYATARVAPELDQKVAERCLATREKAAQAKQVLTDRVSDLNARSVELELRLGDRIGAKVREETKEKVKEIYWEFERANRELILELRHLFADYPDGRLDLLFGGELWLRYYVQVGTLQQQLENISPVSESGLHPVLQPILRREHIHALFQRGMLDPGYNGPLDPTAVA